MNVVPAQVKFTRCLYAQLMQQKFQPDRRSGYTLPAATNAKFRAYDLGMKLVSANELYNLLFVSTTYCLLSETFCNCLCTVLFDRTGVASE